MPDTEDFWANLQARRVLVAELHAEGLTNVQIARQVGTKAFVIRSDLRALGLEHRPTPQPVAEPERRTPLSNAQGYLCVWCARVNVPGPLQTCAGCKAEYARMAAGMPQKEKPERRRAIHRGHGEKWHRIRELRAQGMPVKEIAALCGVKPVYVYNITREAAS